MKRLIDFSSRFRILKGGKISLVVSALLGTTTLTFAAPSGGVVTSGSANISQVGNATNIIQNTGNVTINWDKFNIASDEIVNFKQPDVNSIALNRVIGNEKSIINGALNANGQVWILNSNGVLFGKNAKINTAGLLATTKNLSDDDFNNKNYNFKGSSTESVINLGEIDISDSGYATLLANTVSNEGTIKAVKGSVRLVGADEATINLNGNSIVDLTVNKGVLDSLVENKGAIYSDGGEIYLTTNAVDELLKGVVNNEGIIEANSLDGVTGFVELFAHGGEAKIGGTITAKEGFVETSGKEFTFNDAKIEAGEWLIDPVNVTIDDGLATAIETQLSQGDAIVEADNDIIINSDLTNSGTGNTLILTADVDNSGDGDINVNAVVTVGAGDGITLNYGSNGNLITQRDDSTDTFTGKINLDSTSNVTINGSIYTVVSTTSELQAITEGNNYVLGADIDLINTSWTPFSFFWNNAGTSIDGLGHTVSNLTINTSNSNQGLFARLENASIQNLGLVDSTITGGENTGSLIGFANTVTLNNVFSNATVTGPNSIGGLIGQTVDTNIYNSYHNANVTGTYMDIGGLVGYINGTTLIQNSYAKGILSTGNFSGNSNLGGLVGGVYGTLTINNSYAESTVTGTGDNVGGLVGYDNDVVSINNSYARGTITGVENVGGLVGFLSWDGSTISNSYFSGSVTGTNYVGGLTGTSNGDISNSYALGSVTGDASVGGLIGYMDNGTLTNSYASNTVSSTSMNPSMLGGVVGEFWQGGSPQYTNYDNATNRLTAIQNSYYDNEVNTGTMGDSILGKSQTEILSLANTNWNNTIWTSAAGGANVSGYEVQVGLPYLTQVTQQADKTDSILLFDSGFGIESSPFILTDWNQLQNINYNSDTLSGGYYYSLSNDLTTSTTGYTEQASSTANSDEGWNPIGDNTLAFNGTFDGQNYIIDNLKIRKNIDSSILVPSDYYIGLFGVTSSNSLIKNLGLTNLDISIGIFNHIINSSNSIFNFTVGGLVGLNNAQILNSYVEGGVSLFTNAYETSISSNLGGLVGKNLGEISNSYSNIFLGLNNMHSIFINEAKIGGLVGVNSGEISNSYSLGSLEAFAFETYLMAGGLVGYNTGFITNTYSSTFNMFDSFLSMDMGNLVGLNDNVVTNSFYNADSSYYDNAIGTALSSSAMSYGQIYKDANWDIVVDNTVTSSTPVIKYDTINNKYVWAIAPLSLTYNLGSQSTTYDGTTQSLSNFYTTSSIFGNTYNFIDTNDYKYQVSETDVSGYKNAGVYENIKIASNNEFLEIETSNNTDGTLTINKADATVTANSDTVTYNGTSQNVNGYTVSGLVNNETSSVLDIVTGAGANGTNAGTYKTNLSGSDDNYNLTFVDGQLVINKKDLIVSADNIVKDEGTTDPKLTFTVEGLVNGETLSGEVVREVGESIGEYMINQGTLEANSNYILKYNEGVFTIEPKPEPELPKPEPETEKEIEKVVTTIVNKEAVKVPTAPKVTTTPNNAGKNVNVSFSVGENKQIVSKPIEGQVTKRVTLSEAKQMQQEVTGETVGDVKVPLSRSSQIVLINGGVSLPTGVEQEFYVADDEI